MSLTSQSLTRELRLTPLTSRLKLRACASVGEAPTYEAGFTFTAVDA